MQTLDTNVLVRIVLGDEPKQAACAATHWRQALATGGIFLPVVVIVELVWVMTVTAKLGRERVANELRRLLSMDGVVIENAPVVARAVARFEYCAADFADCLILETARETTALPVYTFDRRFAREAEVVRIEPDESALP